MWLRRFWLPVRSSACLLRSTTGWCVPRWVLCSPQHVREFGTSFWLGEHRYCRFCLSVAFLSQDDVFFNAALAVGHVSTLLLNFPYLIEMLESVVWSHKLCSTRSSLPRSSCFQPLAMAVVQAFGLSPEMHPTFTCVEESSFFVCGILRQNVRQSRRQEAAPSPPVAARRWPVPLPRGC